MRTVPLGATGVRVSAFCLGTQRFDWTIDKPTSFRVLDLYIDAGGTFLDTANIYGRRNDVRVGGLSETLLGDWMRERKNRAHLFIGTKMGFDYAGGTRGLSAQQVTVECEKSLKRLGTDVIDLYFAHVDDRQTPLEETLEAFDRLVKAGKVRLIGASNFLAWRLAEARLISQARAWATYCCIQQRYSYLRPKLGANFDPQIAANDDLLDYCRCAGVTLLAYSPLLAGAYSRPDRTFAQQYLGLDSDARLAALRTVAQQVGATANQVVLAWMAQSQVIPLVTASHPEHVQDNLRALDIALTAEQMSYLNAARA